MAALNIVAGILVVLLFCSIARGAAVPKKLIFTVIGDWGVPNLPYTDVMARVSQSARSQFTVAIGDNFYKGVTIGGKFHGVTSVDDPKWQTIFENQFPQQFFQKPWYVIAGNHDYDGNEMAQVEYTKKSTRWKFPKLYYNFKKRIVNDVTVQFFMIDSHVLWTSDAKLRQDYGRKKDLVQLKRLEKALKKSKATWKIMFSHHPIYTSKGKREWAVKHLVPLLEKYKVALFVNGHVHTFNHVKSPKVHYITVGSTGIQGSVKKKNVGGVDHVFSYPTPEQKVSPQCAGNVCRGFAIITVKGRKTLVLKFYNTKGTLIYTTPEIKNPK